MNPALHNLPHAAEVLNPDGSLRTHGPHIHPAPTFWVKDRTTGKAREVAYTPAPVAGGAAAPTIVTPGNPSDIGSTTNYAANPLFSGSAAASDQDVNQQEDEDCYFLATVDSCLRQCYWYISQLITRRADGMNLITFRRNLLAPLTVCTDSLIGNSFARPNPVTGAIDGPLFEKAFAYERTGANTMLSENIGFIGQAMTDLGITNVTLAPTAASVATAMQATLAGGFPLAGCSLGTIPAGIPIEYAHCYAILKVWTDAAGQVWVLLRNPWGINGQAAPINPPGSQITLTLQQFALSFSAVSAGTKFAADVPTPSTTPTTPPPSPTTTTTTETPMTITVTNRAQVLNTTDQISLAAGATANVAWQSDADKWAIVDSAYAARNQTGAGNGQTGAFTVTTPHILTITFSKAGAADVVYVITVSPAAPAADPIVSVVVTTTRQSGKVTTTIAN